MSELPAHVLSRSCRHLLTFRLVIADCSEALPTEAQERAPVVAPVTHDPYFSIWSMALQLAFDKPGTWSQKYNLVWDILFGMDLLPSSVRKTELAFYPHLNQYGLRLDNRADYTKLDWAATLTDELSQFTALMDPIAKWLRETPTRVSVGDWYDTRIGVALHFQARSVVGTVFIKALADKSSRKDGTGLPRRGFRFRLARAFNQGDVAVDG
jgi:Domain of unknown function (DUF1793)